jgi:hypothetical protein
VEALHYPDFILLPSVAFCLCSSSVLTSENQWQKEVFLCIPPRPLWFKILIFPALTPEFLLASRNLAGKDAGQNNTKMLRGLNADC